jgi:hypothetical protein
MVPVPSVAGVMGCATQKLEQAKKKKEPRKKLLPFVRRTFQEWKGERHLLPSFVLLADFLWCKLISRQSYELIEQVSLAWYQ